MKKYAKNIIINSNELVIIKSGIVKQYHNNNLIRILGIGDVIGLDKLYGVSNSVYISHIETKTEDIEMDNKQTNKEFAKIQNEILFKISLMSLKIEERIKKIFSKDSILQKLNFNDSENKITDLLLSEYICCTNIRFCQLKKNI